MPHSVHYTPRSLTPHETQKGFRLLGQEWWNTNLPQDQWTEECPDYLIGQGQKNMTILSGREEDYHYITWPESKELVATGRIDHFQRSPVELRRYIHYMFKLKQQWGSVLSFVQHKRLHWDSISPSSDPLFTNAADFKILYNDWPYGIDPNITHLVVWTKFLLDDDPDTGFITADHHSLIESFVQETFCDKGGIARQNVIWFRNWKSLKSVHALEHFHVMLYQAPLEFLKGITNNDRPTSELVANI